MAKAAESLATSQPAISRAIADLEYSLGVCLLDRGPRGIVPTPYGHALIRRGIAIFDEAHSTVKCNGQIVGVDENLTRGSVAEYLSGA